MWNFPRVSFSDAFSLSPLTILIVIFFWSSLCVLNFFVISAGTVENISMILSTLSFAICIPRLNRISDSEVVTEARLGLGVIS